MYIFAWVKLWQFNAACFRYIIYTNDYLSSWCKVKRRVSIDKKHTWHISPSSSVFKLLFPLCSIGCTLHNHKHMWEMRRRPYFWDAAKQIGWEVMLIVQKVCVVSLFSCRSSFRTIKIYSKLWIFLECELHISKTLNWTTEQMKLQNGKLFLLKDISAVIPIIVRI